MFAAFQVPVTWGELLKRTAKETNADDCFGLAAQLAYYFFLSLFPAVLFVLALASFFPLTNFIDDVIRTLRPFAATDVLSFLEEQLRRLSNADNGGILTLGMLGALWSNSAAIVAIISSLNRRENVSFVMCGSRPTEAGDWRNATRAGRFSSSGTRNRASSTLGTTSGATIGGPNHE
jgi:hypothetical protein